MRSACNRELFGMIEVIEWKHNKTVQNMELDSHANIIIFEQPCKLEELREQFRITLATTIEEARCHQEQEVQPPGQRPT